MGSLYLWGRSIQEMGSDVVIGQSIYGVVVIDGSLCSRFYGMVKQCITLISSEFKTLASQSCIHRPRKLLVGNFSYLHRTSWK